MEGRILFESGKFRILEHVCNDWDMEDLKGETYSPKVNTDIDPDQLRKEELEFESLVNREGVYGYVLEQWNDGVGKGWEHVDSCWGFVGQYTESEDRFDHYIVNELKSQITE